MRPPIFLIAAALSGMLAVLARANTRADGVQAALSAAQKDFESDETGNQWEFRNDRILRELTSSPAVALPGAREELEAELTRGKIFAAVPLWTLYRDSAAVDALVARLAAVKSDDDPLGSDIPFVLGFLRPTAAVPALKRLVAKSARMPYLQLFCARALYRTTGDPADLESLRVLAKTPHPELEISDQGFKVTGKYVLIDVEKARGAQEKRP